ncbi:DUF983 domain-containing protein [Planctomicrobium sp. SH527]|uniref:DUF983 domain-containing protein n=1 Tax=Planctomicrobium sp. SH527 TaxID=3448123 RepID=UPI003F5C4FD5
MKESARSRPTGTTITVRALKLRCPRCGEGPIFRGFFRMHDQCERCHFNFQREPGYYLGAIYMNYGMTSLISTASYLIGRFYFQIPAQQLVIPLVLFCVGFPLVMFRHSRALWLALDCRVDQSVLEETPEAASPPTTLN